MAETEMGGRAALLSLPEVEAAARKPGLEKPLLLDLVEVLGTAAEVVSAPAELRGAVQALLGEALLVTDRAAARRVLERLRRITAGDGGDDGKGAQGADSSASLPSALRVVTLQGEVYFANGPVLVRSNVVSGEGGGTFSTPLSRPRQIREMRSQLGEIDQQWKAIEEQAGNLDQELRQLREAEKRLSQEQATAAANVEHLRNAQREADLAAEKARRQIQWRREEQNRLESEIKAGQEAIALGSVQLQTLEEEIVQARQKLREINEQLNRLPLDELQTRLSHWVTRLAVAERALAEATRRKQERQSALAGAQKTQAASRARLASIQASIGEIEAQKTGLRQEEIELARQIEALRVQIEPSEAELEAAEKEQSRLQSVEAAARQTLGLDEHQHAQARILLVRRQEALESLQRRIEDDADYVRFGLVAFEYAEDISGQAPLPLDGMVEQLPVVHELSADIEENIKRQRAQLRRIGPINPEAQAEYQGVHERFDFLRAQVTDLTHAQADIHRVIAELDALMEREFRRTFDSVAREFHEIFTRLFGGGMARLLLTNPEDLTETGIEIEARLPGRRTQGLALLSGGERSLTATALVFSLLKVSPTPFCVLDEVDAMLDEANVGRFRDLLRELSQNTQFIVVTHNRNTVQVADVIYGVTMGRDSASQVLSLKLDEVHRVVE
jgi:chromosome segregation protein